MDIETTTDTPLGDTLAVKVEKAAEMLDCSRSQIYNLIRAGQLKSIKLSGGKKAGVRIVTASIFDFVAHGVVPENRELTTSERVAAHQARAKRSSRNW
jgi:excisionase family DNA binding protein